jgi:Xaa-Pro aminopeptidase
MSPDFFASNRTTLAAQLHGGIAVLAAYTGMQQMGDMASDFRQEPNFWWLTGIDTPDWWVIIDGKQGKSWLVAPVVSDMHAIFDGSLSFDEAKATSGVGEVLSHDAGVSMLRSLAKVHSIVYALGDVPYAEYVDFVLNPAQKKMHDTLTRTFQSVRDCRKELAALRGIKQPVEIEVMKRAIATTIDAFTVVRDKLPEFQYEYEVEAEFGYHFRRHGADGHAYAPIVAGGHNACTLHYVKNSQKLHKRQLLLLDVGASVSNYSADITRTYAIGQPSKRQVAVHAAVQAAHHSIIALLAPGVRISEYRQQVDQIMKTALVSVGLMADMNDGASYRQYFPHAISHGLGIEPHDSLGAPTYFQPGMVLTVEPGIYIPEESTGVRIEDDILITDTGHDNLSHRLSTALA